MIRWPWRKPSLPPFITTSCEVPTAADRMARYSRKHATRMQMLDNMSVAEPPLIRRADGSMVLVALPGKPNRVGNP